ncbi:hypothetical protein AB9K34_12625 [Sedimentitalea sp. XS_ASV28]|uniref:hypothetical protein n=1 Tax=Sedimentitalea sp. XS_ASV28 TaxID=3241296 RepID=UPI00351892F8
MQRDFPEAVIQNRAFGCNWNRSFVAQVSDSWHADEGDLAQDQDLPLLIALACKDAQRKDTASPLIGGEGFYSALNSRTLRQRRLQLLRQLEPCRRSHRLKVIVHTL